MVSKFIAMGILVGTAFANKLKVDEAFVKEHFKSAISKDDFKEHTSHSLDLKLDDLVKTHSCSTKLPNLCLIRAKESFALTCSAKKHSDFDAGINEESKFNLYGKEVKDIERIECQEVKKEHQFEEKFESALRAMGSGTKKEKITDLEKVEGDHTNCLVVEEVEKKEEKKEGEDKKEEKKEDKKEEKKEEKKEVKVFFFTVKEKEYKPTEEVKEVEILGKKYKALFCGNDETLEKEAKAFAKEVAGGCCGCWVWAVVILGVVGVGAGAWYVLKDDDVEEDEFADQYA